MRKTLITLIEAASYITILVIIVAVEVHTIRLVLKILGADD
jgi:hypothetical protein